MTSLVDTTIPATLINILVVEDDRVLSRMIRFSLDHFLKKDRTKLHSASNGKEAIDILFNNEIDVVLTDIRMPVMDGIEACARIKEYNEKIPVIIFSAFTDQKTRERARLAGADAFIPKPVDMQLIAIKIVSLIKRQTMEKLHQPELLNLSDRLNKLMERRALTGIDTPPDVLIEIERIKQEIEELK